MHASQTEIEKSQARNALEDKRGSEEAIVRRIPRSVQIPPMGGQYSIGTKERW